jgi:replicative DNA helicase
VNRDDYSVPDTIPDPPEDDSQSLASSSSPEKETDVPASVHMELAVLGAMMLERKATQEAFTLLVAEDFSLDSHQRIFKAIQAVTSGYDLGESEDVLMLVREELLRRRELESIGGISYLCYLTEGIPRNFNINSYVRIVKDKSLLRRLMSVFHDGEIRASDQGEDGINIATEIIAQVTLVVESSQTKTEVFDSPTMAMDAAQRLLDNPKLELAIPTGFKPLDDFTGGGIRLGELWVVGASPSRGKTTLARQIVKHVVRQGIPSYVHSGEMTKESWYDVTACLLVSMPSWKIREPWLLNDYEKDMLRAGIKELSSLPFHISDAGGIHIDKLIWNASCAIRQHQIKLLVVDYAQIISANGKDDRQKVTSVAQKLRVFAKDNNVAVILLSQSPRPEGRNINSRPNMFSLKESGALEEAAHTIILPFRRVDTETNAFTGEDELVIGKQRHGPIGSIPCRLDGKYLKFEPRDDTQY